MALAIKVQGMKETIAMMERAENGPAKVDELRQAFAFQTHAGIVRLTPVDTGFLKAANVVLLVGPVITFTDLANYAPYQEFGTGRAGAASFERFLPAEFHEEEGLAFATYWTGVKAQPFMRPGVAAGLKWLERRIDELAVEIGEGESIVALRKGFE